MLQPDQAQAELKKLENPQWIDVRVGSADRLPKQMRATARLLLGQDEQPALLDQAAQERYSKKILDTFSSLDEAGRFKMFEAFHPSLAPSIERAWQLFDRLPYQTGWDRKPFRAPSDQKARLVRRVNWLVELLEIAGRYEKDVAWFAEWAPHLAFYTAADNLGILFAAAIDGGGNEGEEVFNILCESAKGEHPVGGMGRHVTRALLSASRPDGWEFVENLLLAAQREEGLRQTILETIDEAHPDAFRRMLRLILDKNLSRFSATVRALDVWVGLQWDAISTGVVNATIEKILACLDDSDARDTALKGKDAEGAYLALWALAFDDAPSAIGPASELLKHPKAEHRFAAAHLLDQLQLVDAQNRLLDALEDSDLRVATRAALAFQRVTDTAAAESDLFERFEALLPRYPDKPEKLKPAIWPWTAYTVSKKTITRALPGNLGKRSPTRLIPHLPRMEAHDRAQVVNLLSELKKWDAETRETLFALVGDPSQSVRESAVKALAKCSVTAEEAHGIENLLTRKTGDLRRGVLALLSRQSDADVLASAERLLTAKSQPQRLAGLELLRQLAGENRCVAASRSLAENYRKNHPTLNDAERKQLDAVLAAEGDVPTLDNALGLLNHDERTWPLAPVARKVRLHTPAARRIVSALAELLVANAQEPVVIKTESGDDWKGLLSDIQYGFPLPDPKKPASEDRERLPLAEVWEKWWETRGPEFRDDDGMELLRALSWHRYLLSTFPGYRAMVNAFPNESKQVFGEPVSEEEIDGDCVWKAGSILTWLIRLYPENADIDFIFDAAESALTLVPPDCLELSEKDEAEDENRFLGGFGRRSRFIAGDFYGAMAEREARMNWQKNDSPFTAWLETAKQVFAYAPQIWTPEHHGRYWRLLRWLDEPVRPREAGGGDRALPRSRCLPRVRPDLIHLCHAYEANAATEADVVEQLLGARGANDGYWRMAFGDLGNLTRRKSRSDLARFDFLPPIVDRCRRRVLEVELDRGENPTDASSAALSLRSVWGIDNLVGILHALGKGKFIRGWAQDNLGRSSVFSHLVRCSFPLDDETPEDFAEKVSGAGIPEDRLIEVAVYAPQWARFVEEALGWECLTEAVWWIHAHTKGSDWTVDQEIRELWEADMSGRTPLSSADLLDGAVDVAWFHRVHRALGNKRWSRLYDGAKLASTGAGHARARLFADAMLGQVRKTELKQRVQQKRHQDAVRALGLLPLAAGKKRDADLLDRYALIQTFRRTSKQFGSQRQASEKRAAQIGQENLARTAGFADPIRLEWAMEAKAVEDFADGPVETEVEGVKVSLGIDPWGAVDLTVSRDGKTLAAVPAKLRKNREIAALRERKTELKRQASRIRPSLEQFMIRGDELTGAELGDLLKHPLLAPMLTHLVIVGDGFAGYPVHDGRALEDYNGKLEGIKPDDKLRIAHPHDLLPAAQWHRWQKDCFARERIQPFKQVFRELYPLTDTEKTDGIQTRRYAGHQVQPRQAIALLGQRGWVNHPEEGVRKVFHEAGLVVWLTFQETFYTPAEIEGLTLESACFTRRGEHKPVKLTDVPPRLFSESMRDLDLVVSVAHRGEVDPEASASTVEMRSALIEETCRLLKIANVRIQDRYALIEGALGEYSVHLGSGVTRKMPGESLFIVPVHSQHRGRLFLPFADDDPRTAEVMSKVLLLARDDKIKDPTILDQIRAN